MNALAPRRPARRRLLVVALLFVLADVALGAHGCDSCAARPTSSAVTR